MLGETAKSFLHARSPISALRRLRDERSALGYDPQLWRDMVDLGWSAMVFPESAGGLDFGFKGLGAVFGQCGRTLAATPLLSTVVLSGGLLMQCASAAQRARLLPQVMAGDTLMALALDEGSRHDPRRVMAQASRVDSGWRLQGDKCFVLDGHVAQQLIVVARSGGVAGDEDGLSLFLVEAGAPGVSVQRTHMVDSRNAANIHLDGVVVSDSALLGVAGGGLQPLDRVLDRARVCLAAELLGLMQEAFDRTLVYLKQRVQFDVLIGSFQALQHRAARLFVELEMLTSCVAAALAAIDADDPQLPLLASLAKARASDLSERLLGEAVQLHGGIGVTDALDLGLLVKRGRVLQQSLGDGVFHRDRYALLKRF